MPRGSGGNGRSNRGTRFASGGLLGELTDLVKWRSGAQQSTLQLLFKKASVSALGADLRSARRSAFSPKQQTEGDSECPHGEATM